MNTKYQICLIIPPGYIHSLCFNEVVLLLKSSLNTLGIDCDIVSNNLSDTSINIIVGYHLLRFNQSLLKYEYIPYQLEQLGSKEFNYSEDVNQILKNAYTVWDYSEENIEFLKKLNIQAKHLPIGYHENLEQIKHSTEKDIDILFYGSIGERRKTIIEELAQNKNIKVVAGFGLYGKERDNHIARSKIILNVHHYSTNIFEAVRISYLLNNKCFVVSENYLVNPYENIEIPMVPYENIVETCQYYLNNVNEIEDIRNKTYAQFKNNYPMTELIKNVI